MQARRDSSTRCCGHDITITDRLDARIDDSPVIRSDSDLIALRVVEDDALHLSAD